jgi:hypothetical protein
MLALAEPPAPFILLIIAIGVSPAIFAMFHATRKRELEHKERMKALEMGLPVPGAAPWPALTAIAIGAGVPIAALAAALIATAMAPRPPADADHLALSVWTQRDQTTGYHGLVWGGASGIGVTAVLAGAVLAWRYMGLRHSPSHNHHAYDEAGYAAKPPLDPDAYDTVSRRG